MTIYELLEHYRYKLSLPNLTQRSRTVAEETYSHLTKQKPMKVGVTHSHDWSVEDSCRACYESVTEAMNYCPYCGQAIDWED